VKQATIKMLAFGCVSGALALAGWKLFWPAPIDPAPERIALWPDHAPIGDGRFAPTNAFISVYRPAQTHGTSVVVCPGGGYRMLVLELEGLNIARWLNRQGITAVVLEYRLPNGNPAVPLLDAQRAIRLVRSMAGEWNCRSNRVGILGFSAGGHLAATAATRFDDGNPSAPDPIDRVGSRPDFALLVYPVITMGPLADAGSRRNLLGPDPTAETVAWFSNELQVTARNPPAFLVHAKDDIVVPSDNSRLFFEALQAHGIPAEYHELPGGGHGLGYGGPFWGQWQAQAIRWMARL
jgi:acetyl esterase/lipase